MGVNEGREGAGVQNVISYAFWVPILNNEIF